MILLLSLFLTALSQVPLNSLHKISGSESTHKLSGRIPIDSLAYQALCECAESTQELIKSCRPTKIKLTEDRESSESLYKEISEGLSAESIEYVRSWGESLRCVDGRDTKSGISTLGGDVGEFLLALIVFEGISGKILDFLSVKRALEEWVKVMGAEKFYMCTDEAAVLHLTRQLAADLDIFNPRKEYIQELLKIVAVPASIGDSHLRLMVEFPQMYSIRAEVVKHLIGAFYEIMWNEKEDGRDLMMLDVLYGEHQEKAFVEIRASEECRYEGVSPLVDRRKEWFLSYPDAVEPRRKQLAEFFAVKIGKDHAGITAEKMYKRMSHHALLFLDTTGRLIARDLPFYTALFL